MGIDKTITIRKVTLDILDNRIKFLEEQNKQLLNAFTNIEATKTTPKTITCCEICGKNLEKRLNRLESEAK